MKSLEEAAKAVVLAWKARDFLRPSIDELEKILLSLEE